MHQTYASFSPAAVRLLTLQETKPLLKGEDKIMESLQEKKKQLPTTDFSRANLTLRADYGMQKEVFRNIKTQDLLATLLTVVVKEQIRDGTILACRHFRSDVLWTH